VRASRATNGPSLSNLHQGRMHQPFREAVLSSLVDAPAHEEHALSAVLERLEQAPRVYVVALR
jgi:hypothetical protein